MRWSAITVNPGRPPRVGGFRVTPRLGITLPFVRKARWLAEIAMITATVISIPMVGVASAPQPTQIKAWLSVTAMRMKLSRLENSGHSRNFGVWAYV